MNTESNLTTSDYEEVLASHRDELLAALKECLGRLHWLNDPRTGNTEKPWIKIAEKAIAKVEQSPVEQSPAEFLLDDTLIKKIRDIWWKSKSSHLMRKDTAIEIIRVVLQSTEKTPLELYENDPVFHLVAQHYPLTAKHVESIYREVVSIAQRRESKPLSAETFNTPAEVVPDCVKESLTWLESALNCENFHWDGDQYEAAKYELERAKLWLEKQSPAVAVPDGWKLMPIEISTDMLRYTSECTKLFGSDGARKIRSIYHFLCESAPDSQLCNISHPAVAVPDYDHIDAMIDELRDHLGKPPHLSGKEFIKGCLHALDTLKCRTKTKRAWLLRNPSPRITGFSV